MSAMVTRRDRRYLHLSATTILVMMVDEVCEVCKIGEINQVDEVDVVERVDEVDESEDWKSVSFVNWKSMGKGENSCTNGAEEFIR